MNDFDFNIGFNFDEEKPKETVKVHRAGKRHLTRKAASEAALESALNWHFENGDCYHCFSFGDVDSLSYLKFVLKQQKIKYLGLSTWCMAGEDVRDLESWHDRGFIETIDLFVGEIFEGSCPEAATLAKQLCKKCGGRFVVFRNHSKIMMIKGERFDCLVESSANVNTNPRSENTVLTVESELVDAYVNLFKEIKPFNRS